MVVGIIDDAVRDGGETFYLNLSNATGATLSDGQVTGTINNTERLTASFEGVPEAHDGQSAFSFRILFSEPVGISYKTLRDESFTTTGGAVTGARRGRRAQRPVGDRGRARGRCGRGGVAGRRPRLRYGGGRCA